MDGELLGKTSQKYCCDRNDAICDYRNAKWKCDASVGDNAVIIDYQKNNPNVKLKTVEDASFEIEYYGLMVKKGNQEMIDILNEGIQK